MNTIRRCKPLLGTYVEITLSGSKDDDTLLDLSSRAFDQISNIEQLMSFHADDSELTILNHTAYKTPCPISTELETVLKQALTLSELTDGLYDITIAPELIKRGTLPRKAVDADHAASWRDIELKDGIISFNKELLIDLGGIAKGYAVDCALSVIPEDVAVTVNAGGDLRMSHWQGQQIEIRIPPADTFATVMVPMQNCAIATSANYLMDKSDSIIICPKTRRLIDQQNSYSVFADSCMLADALTKVAFLEQDDYNLLASLNAQAVSVDPSGNLSFL